MNIISDKIRSSLYQAGVRSLGNEHARHLKATEVREAGVSSYVDQAAMTVAGIGLAILTAKAAVYGFNHQPPEPRPTPPAVYDHNLNQTELEQQLLNQPVSLPAPDVSPVDVPLSAQQSVSVIKQ